jgi:hypothetical protein
MTKKNSNSYPRLVCVLMCKVATGKFIPEWSSCSLTFLNLFLGIEVVFRVLMSRLEPMNRPTRRVTFSRSCLREVRCVGATTTALLVVASESGGICTKLWLIIWKFDISGDKEKYSSTLCCKGASYLLHGRMPPTKGPPLL